MDRQIIGMLQERATVYRREFERFTLKADPAAVFEHECIYYFEPLSKFVLPLLAHHLREYPEESIAQYLPYVLEKYHDAVIKEICSYKKSEDSFSKKSAKDIVAKYNSEVMKYQKKEDAQKLGFVSSFIAMHATAIHQICLQSPQIWIEVVSSLRTPMIQYALVDKQLDNEALREFILDKLQTSQWEGWLDKYFCYPRTSSIDEYMQKWIGKEQIHIKMAKPIFGGYYEQGKLWLKNKEKENEKKKGRR